MPPVNVVDGPLITLTCGERTIDYVAALAADLADGAIRRE
jgi:hypothetical protein